MGAYMWVHVWQEVLIRENYNLHCASKLTKLPAQSLAHSAQDLIWLRKEVSEHKNLKSGIETKSPRETTEQCSELGTYELCAEKCL